MIEKKGFDLGALLADVPELNTGREQIEYIALDLIDDDPNNFYRVDGLEELATNIAMCRLQQPIRVRRHPNDAGRYMIVSGHRRRAAVKLLAEEAPEKWREIACIVEQDVVSPSLQQLRLIFANANTRAMTSSELSEQAVQVEKLLYQLKEEGYEFPGRMRDHVAKAVNASTTKLARLKVIRENLAFCWKPAYKDSKLAESTAYALAQMPISWQQMLFDEYGSNPGQLYEGSTKEFMSRFYTISKTKCGGKKNIVCSHKDKMMKKSCKDRWTNPCMAGCCLKCPTLRTCRSACQKASGKKKQLQDTFKVESQQRKAEQENEDRPKIELLKTLWHRFATARNQAGKTVSDTYQHANIYESSSAGKEIAELESGDAKVKADTRPPYGSNFYLWEIQRLIKVAEYFNCSIDYLLGRSEDLRPTGGWQQGNPWNMGQYAVMIRWSKGSKITVEKMEWDGERWRQFGDEIEIFGDSEIFGWMELPEEVQQDA